MILAWRLVILTFLAYRCTPKRGHTKKMRFSDLFFFSSALYLSETTSNEILATLDYSLCTFGAFLISEFCRKRFLQTTKGA